MTQYPGGVPLPRARHGGRQHQPDHRLRRRRHRGHRGGRRPQRPRGVRAERGAHPQGRPGHDRARSRRTSTPSARGEALRATPGATATRRRPRTSGCSRRAVGGGRPAACRSGSAPVDPGRAALVARERPAPRGGRLLGRLGLGPLHGPGRQDRAGRRGVDDPGGGGRRRPRGSPSVRSSLNVMNRHPAVLARMASTLQIVERRPAACSASGSAATRPSTRRSASTFPDGPGAGRPARGGRRGPAGAVDRRSGHPAVAVLPARGRVRPSRSPSRRRRSSSAARPPAGARLAGRDRRRLVDVRRQLRAEPAALPRGARGAGRRRDGPARDRGLPGRRLARRRPAGRDRAGSATRAPTWQRWQRGGRRRRRSSSLARPTTSTPSSTPSGAGEGAPGDSVAPSTAPMTDAAPTPRDARPIRPIAASAAARRSRSTSALCERCNPLGLARHRPARRSTARSSSPSRWRSSAWRSSPASRSPASARSRRSVPAWPPARRRPERRR